MKIVIPETVVSIGSSAIVGCNSLEELTLPFIGTSLTAGERSCVLGSIFTTNSTVYDIPDGYIYQGCYQAHITTATKYYHDIPRTLRKVTVTNQTSIPTRAFYNCDFIEEIVLSDQVVEFGDKAFLNCNATITYFTKEE